MLLKKVNILSNFCTFSSFFFKPITKQFHESCQNLYLPAWGQTLSILLYFRYKYSFVKCDVSLYSTFWTINLRSLGPKLTTGLSELSWTCPESIFEESLGRVCGLKKISGIWGNFFSCLPKKTQSKSQKCSLRARKENLKALFGKKINFSSAPSESFCRMLCGKFWHLVGNCFPCVRRKNRRNFVFSDKTFPAFLSLRPEIFSKFVRTSFQVSSRTKWEKYFSVKKMLRTFLDL